LQKIKDKNFEKNRQKTFISYAFEKSWAKTFMTIYVYLIFLLNTHKAAFEKAEKI